ncbi:MAG TPA: ABC transporter permease [Gaiellaceae bacterium]|nr:ABC transporter permease [Gaiellaceae bacterium]
MHAPAAAELSVPPAARRRPRRVPVARRNLLAEKARLLMSVGGVACAVLLILVVASLYRGWGAAGGVFADLPGDVWLAQAGTSDPLRTSSFLPADRLDAVAAVPGVRAVVPVYARRVTLDPESRELNVYFLSLAVPSREAWPDDAQRFLPPPGAVVVDAVFAEAAGLETGDGLDVLGRRLTVERVVPGGNPLFEVAFVNGADGRRLLGLEGFVSFFLLAVEPGADVDAVARAAVAAVPGSEARTSADFADATRELVRHGFLPVVGALMGIGFAIGGAVIALTVYTATVEKARDFGVLKAIGADDPFVYRIVVRQSLAVGVAGAAFGVVAASLVPTLVRRAVPEFVTDLRPLDAAAVFAVALVVSVVAAVAPVLRISRIDPATVFRA